MFQTLFGRATPEGDKQNIATCKLNTICRISEKEQIITTTGI